MLQKHFSDIKFTLQAGLNFLVFCIQLAFETKKKLLWTTQRYNCFHLFLFKIHHRKNMDLRLIKEQDIDMGIQAARKSHASISAMSRMYLFKKLNVHVYDSPHFWNFVQIEPRDLWICRLTVWLSYVFTYIKKNGLTLYQIECIYKKNFGNDQKYAGVL